MKHTYVYGGLLLVLLVVVLCVSLITLNSGHTHHSNFHHGTTGSPFMHQYGAPFRGVTR